jgi:hypothetical protein
MKNSAPGKNNARERFDFEKVRALALPARATRRDMRRGFLEKPCFSKNDSE